MLYIPSLWCTSLYIHICLYLYQHTEHFRQSSLQASYTSGLYGVKRCTDMHLHMLELWVTAEVHIYNSQGQKWLLHILLNEITSHLEQQRGKRVKQEDVVLPLRQRSKKESANAAWEQLIWELIGALSLSRTMITINLLSAYMLARSFATTKYSSALRYF